MTRKGLYVACGVLLFTALCYLCTGCRQTAPGHEAVPVERLREGDLVFRLGSSIESRVVRATDARKTRYSHVGVLVQEGGQWFVVHAVPGEHEGRGDSDRVKMERPALMTVLQLHAQHRVIGLAVHLHLLVDELQDAVLLESCFRFLFVIVEKSP